MTSGNNNNNATAPVAEYGTCPAHPEEDAAAAADAWWERERALRTKVLACFRNPTDAQ
jgi:hypothetical protein